MVKDCSLRPFFKIISYLVKNNRDRGREREMPVYLQYNNHLIIALQNALY